MALHLKSTGIDFADFSDQAVSLNSELLNDYEQGTWTPGMNVGWEAAGGGNQIYRSTYVKTGNHVWMHFAADWGQTGTSMATTGGAYAADYTVPITICSQGNYTKNGFARYGGSTFNWTYSSYSAAGYFDSVYTHVLEGNIM